MAKNLASVKPVKCYTVILDDQPEVRFVGSKRDAEDVPCTLLTTARYKYIARALKKAQEMLVLYDDPKSNKPERIAALHEFSRAMDAAEKAGAV